MPRYGMSKITELVPQGDRPVVYLLDATGTHEVRMLQAWIREETGEEGETIRIDSSRRGRGGEPERLFERLTGSDDPMLIPLRVVWIAPERRGRRVVGWSDVFKPGDPRDPYPLRSRWIKTFHPKRVVLLSGQAANASELIAAHDAGEAVDGLVPYVTRRAWMSLDLGERALRGNRYKVPRFVHEWILTRRSFVDQVHEFADRTGEDPNIAMKRAERYLREIAATHSPYVIDLVANAIHALYRQGYGAIEYQPEQIEMIAGLGQKHPLVFLPAHRSNLDRLSTQFILWEHDLPPNHTAGGINLNFFPIGPLLRRTGVFFIRRSFKDNELYKIVLRAYVDFLVEKRFPIEWYLEGGRSRSGKLQAPRFGLLQYVVDSLRRGKADDIVVVPVSIVYDQIQDVPDYAREAQGKEKEKESVRWMVRAIRSLRRRYGNIHVRYGTPLSVAEVLSTIEDREEPSIGLQKLAFEVLNRIARATPITPIAVVSIALLAARGKPLTAMELGARCAELQKFIDIRGLEMTEDLELSDPDVVTALLEGLAGHKAVSSHEAIGRTVFWLDESQMIQVSYYRNIVVHYFLSRAIAEVGLTIAAAADRKDRDFLEETMLGIRDLLKFEFFFADRERFVSEIFSDLAVDVPDWESVLASGGPEVLAPKLGEPVAHWVLLPILDGYQIVGDELEVWDGPFNEKAFLKACLARGRMYRIEGQVISGESVSQVLFKSALSLAANRELLDGSCGPEARAAFAAEIREARRHAASGIGL